MTVVNRKSSTATYRYGLLDPRLTNLAAKHNASMFTKRPIWGVEVTVPDLANSLDYNIDPQHTDGDVTTAAIEQALSGPLPPDGTTLVTVRPDLDSVGSMAVFALRAYGHRFNATELGKIHIIAISDKFQKGPWPGPRPLPNDQQLSDDYVSSVEDNSYLAAIAAAIDDDAQTLRCRVDWLQQWIQDGSEPPGYRDAWVEQRQQLVRALTQGGIRPYVVKAGLQDVAVVESSYRAPTSLGYHLAPVVISRNVNHYFRQDGPLVKYTVSQWPDRHYVDLPAVLTDLSKLEPGWGGSPTIGGSPQGQSSRLDIEDVLDAIAAHV